MAVRVPTLCALHPFVLVAALLCLLAATPAHADPSGLFSGESVSAFADLRLVAADGERSWADGGFGKSRFGGADDQDWKLRAVPTEAELIWQPRFSWSLSGTVAVAAQDGQDHPADLIEAYVTFKPLLKGGTHLSGRAGLYWPSVSLEHQGAAWQVADMITPSAINSWIGEEVKLVGAEATLAQDIGANQLSGTIGIFGFNDTAGTLLAFRGWALHDLKATAFGHQPLPHLNEQLEYAQAAKTRPLIEVDDRPGFYAKLQWRMAAPVTLNAFYYRNRGDPEAVTNRLQWGWDTRFWNVGGRFGLGRRTTIMAQALTGTTEMGYEAEGHHWVETRFRSAYGRISHIVGKVTVSARYDVFDTREHGSYMDRGESEKGWAGTAAISWKLTSHVNILGEVLHIESKRGGVREEELGLPARQRQTVVQASIRLSY